VSFVVTSVRLELVGDTSNCEDDMLQYNYNEAFYVKESCKCMEIDVKISTFATKISETV